MGGGQGGAEVVVSCCSASTTKSPTFGMSLVFAVPIAKLSMKPSRDLKKKKKEKQKKSL